MDRTSEYEYSQPGSESLIKLILMLRWRLCTRHNLVTVGGEEREERKRKAQCGGRSVAFGEEVPRLRFVKEQAQ
jgi:hypothetical protein